MTASVAEVELDQALRIFLAERTRLLRLAYRVVGDIAAAEDVVQDAWLRWQRVDRREINNPAAFLTTATTHLAINVIQSARHRHELPTDAGRLVLGTSDDPTRRAERTLATERLLGFMMAKLRPAELAAFVLRKCFEYPYQDIADLLGVSDANARQLVRRAHTSIAAPSVRSVDTEAHRRMVAAFTAAAEQGELADLLSMLADLARTSRGCPRSQGASRPRRGARVVTSGSAARSSRGPASASAPVAMTKGAIDD
jgi:RNA polymerase sigma-70 factor (ECF subfamily)